MRRFGRFGGEAGNMAPLAIGACFVLAAALGLVCDLAAVHVVKQRQEQALDAARSYCMDALGASPAKYAADPGAELSDAIVEQVRAQGVDDAVSVWFYELPEQACPENERGWVIGMQVERRQALPFAPAGVGDASVASSRVFTAKPYASQRVWRPPRRICGAYSFEEGAGAGRGSFSPIGSLEGFPLEVVQAATALRA